MGLIGEAMKYLAPVDELLPVMNRENIASWST
jgi:hypothetical protein